MSIDAEAPLSAFTLQAVQQIERLAPFGQGNARPLLCTSGVTLAGPPQADGRRRAAPGDDALAARRDACGPWPSAAAIGPTSWPRSSGPIDVAFRPVINTFAAGRTSSCTWSIGESGTMNDEGGIRSPTFDPNARNACSYAIFHKLPSSRCCGGNCGGGESTTRGCWPPWPRCPASSSSARTLRDEAYADCALANRLRPDDQPALHRGADDAKRWSCPASEKVLEIGTGSGYQTAILAEMAREVVTIERHAELRAARGGDASPQLGYGNVTLVVGDGTLGWPGGALRPDPGHRGGGHVPPPLFEQLADGGVLVIPIGGPDSRCCRRFAASVPLGRWPISPPGDFVPLVGAEGSGGLGLRGRSKNCRRPVAVALTRRSSGLQWCLTTFGA